MPISSFSRSVAPQSFSGRGISPGSNGSLPQSYVSIPKSPYQDWLNTKLGNVQGIGKRAIAELNAKANESTGFDSAGANTGGYHYGKAGTWKAASSTPGWSQYDDNTNTYINNASKQYGVPANLIKAMIQNESSGNWGRDGGRLVYLNSRGESILPYVGMFEGFAKKLGFNAKSLVNDEQGQINVMASALADIYGRPGVGDKYGWEGVVSQYFGGVNPNNMTFVDENGMSTSTYYNNALRNWRMLDSKATGTVTSTSGPINGMWGGNSAGNAVVQKALEFVGKVPYVWGSIPGKGQNPTGWDCSGMTYWLDQNYGDGKLPQGSHYQYQYAQQTGKLFTNVGNLQVGDLLFFDTNNQRGAGAGLNRAGHVAIYIGNGQILHAANEQLGTVVSTMSDYYNTAFLGAMHMSFSGGAGGSTGKPATTPSPWQIQYNLMMGRDPFAAF